VLPNRNLREFLHRGYAIPTIIIEWSEIPASRARWEYRQHVILGISEGVAKA
jgi:hypothetical protein